MTPDGAACRHMDVPDIQSITSPTRISSIYIKNESHWQHIYILISRERITHHTTSTTLYTTKATNSTQKQQINQTIYDTQPHNTIHATTTNNTPATICQRIPYYI